MKGLRGKTIKGVKWSALAEVIDHAIGFVVFIILARLLAPADFGLVALASVFVSFMGAYVSFGIGQAIIQRDDLTEAHLNSAFWANIGMGAVTALVGYLSAPFIAAAFNQPDLAAVLQWLSLGFFVIALNSVQSALVRRDFKFKTLAVRSVVAMVCGGVVAIVMAVYGYGVWSLVARVLVQRGIGVLLLWRISPWRPAFSFSFDRFWELARFGLTVTGTELMVLLNRRSDNLLIGYFLGPVMLGYYTVAYRLLLLLFQAISKTISHVGMPAFARMQNDPDRAARAFYEISQLTAFVALPVFIGVSAAAPELVTVIYGEKWAPSIPVMQVLLLIGVVHTMLRLTAAVIVGMGHPAWRLKLQIVDGIATLTVFFVAVHWGLVAVAIGYVAIGYLQSPLWYFVLRRVIPLRFGQLATAWRGTVISTALMVITILCVRYVGVEHGWDAWLRASLMVCAGALVYLGTIWKVDAAGTRRVLFVARRVVSRPPKPA